MYTSFTSKNIAPKESESVRHGLGYKPLSIGATTFMENETWKDVAGYEGIYKVSNTGNIKRCISNRCRKERILKCSNHRGYKMVTLSKDAVHNRQMLHRLIAIAFIPNPHSKPFINHIDSNPKNNHVGNLEWCTQSENIRHSFAMGNKSGERHPMCRLKNDEIKHIRASQDPLNEIASRFVISRQIVWRIKSGRTYKDIL